MPVHVPPPQRGYRQLVRVVKDKSATSHYQLANAYGEGPRVAHTDLRMRTLEELGLPSVSPRRPAPTVSGGNFSRRDSTIMFHQLNPQTRGYFSGVSPLVVSRSDTSPGTKMRTGVGVDSFSTKIEASIGSSMGITTSHGGPNSQDKDKQNGSQPNHATGFSAFN
ncbi:hypothetical protein [Aliagarivorans marinus]|uniref:hypothetical protein n=1 Tax=Aliagarivorans marinus TaxID=561965 RepID=UPI00047D774F|nr:hypothetical protein [Aliagarivorans marinus]